MGDPIKKAELAKQSESKQKEIDALRREANRNNQKIIEEKLIYKDAEMDDLRRRYENETDPIKKAELARQLESKQKEIDALKRQGQLTSDNQRIEEKIIYKDAEMDDLRKRYENETDALRREANKNNQKIIEGKLIYKDAEMDDL